MNQGRVTERAKDLVREYVGRGDMVVDATVGNGYDTVFLAELVGERGKVIGFDVQEEAIVSASRKVRAVRGEAVEAADFGANVDLHLIGHEDMAQVVTGLVRAVMFNLGYLPGGDHGLVTEPGTTVTGLEAALDILAPGGVVTVVVYPGHEGGKAEAEAVASWVEEGLGGKGKVLVDVRGVFGEGVPYLVAVELIG
ncbi:MAG: class I SAM-dependent methyltransferase [Verrucomicrobiota bacterium]